MMDSHAPTQLVLIATVCLVACGAWLLQTGSRNMTAGVPLRMGGANVLLSGGVCLIVIRSQPDWPRLLTHEGSVLLLLGGFTLLWHCCALIAHERMRWRGPTSVTLVTMLALMLTPHSHPAWAGLGSMGLMLLNAGLAHAAFVSLRQRLSRLMAGLLISPYAALALFFGARALASSFLPAEKLNLMQSSRGTSVWLWVGFVMVLLINTQAAFLLVLDLVLKLQQLTRIDPLTGALNRRAFDAALQTAQAQARRGLSYSLVLMDMDHFKKLNDELGHAAGDAALRHLVDQCRPMLRNVDALGRLGGEEFCLLLHNADINGAALVAERIRQQLQQTRWAWQGRDWQLRASFGVAQREPSDADAAAVLARADAALYEAKRMGRDLVR